MLYAVQRYAATRPWARRVGQLYTQAVQAEAVQQEGMALVARELERAAQVYPAASARIATEQRLADAYGQFCRHGRVMAQLDSGLMQALEHTRLPANMPERLSLPANAFYLHAGEQGGAFVMHLPDSRAVALLLLAADFSLPGRDWLAQGEQSLALLVNYPGELAAPMATVAPEWHALLAMVLGGLAVMTQPKLEMVCGWEEAAPAELVALASHPTCVKSRKKGRSQLLQAGFQEVSYCRMAGVADTGTAFASQGYWRRQALNDAQGGSRLVWVMPR
ncbi:hypothetical protein [Aquitalea sp. LB_tupeE]|uniref:hypothetical protein n=1 Tax=Aquitalea sp. LB_tupeE TaxID=2748078 RepID=UPI0015BCEAB1|nr:hypothetical protein [Aquitalea sp. LB_tupeE]NWK79996.1 hypothetical protein [Aquitalea sp. LB_tupeE]